MAPRKIDDVIECVRYVPDGRIDVVRVYERRGDTFTDVLLLDRAALLSRLRNNQRVVVGKRQIQLASTFEIISEVRLGRSTGREMIVAGDAADDRDDLDGAPLF